MVSRLTALLLALVMGVPLCLCCTTATAAGSGPAAEEGCAACQYAEPETASLPAHDRHGDRRCCAESTLRTLSPDTAAAPRLILVDLEAPEWSTPDLLSPPSWVDLPFLAAGAPHAPPWHGPPLYQRNCALLL